MVRVPSFAKRSETVAGTRGISPVDDLASRRTSHRVLVVRLSFITSRPDEKIDCVRLTGEPETVFRTRDNETEREGAKRRSRKMVREREGEKKRSRKKD